MYPVMRATQIFGSISSPTSSCLKDKTQLCGSSVAPCKGIQGSRGFRIPHRGFRIPTVGFRTPCPWIPDSKLSVIPDSKVLNSGFTRISKANILKLFEVVYLNKKVYSLSKRSKFILISKACVNTDASL